MNVERNKDELRLLHQNLEGFIFFAVGIELCQKLPSNPRTSPTKTVLCYEQGSCNWTDHNELDLFITYSLCIYYELVCK